MNHNTGAAYGNLLVEKGLVSRELLESMRGLLEGPGGDAGTSP